MATVVGGYVGSAIGGPVGGYVGAMVGSYIDSLWIAELFPPPDIKGPRMQDLQLQGADYGAPIHRCYGNRVRVPGSVIWLTDLIETENTQSTGGKGGRSQSQSQFTYSAHMAVAVCSTDTTPFSRVLQVFADGKLLYDVRDTTQDITSDQLYGTVSFTVNTAGPTGSVPTYKYHVRVALKVFSDDISVADISRVASGKYATLSGFVSPAGNNNKTMKVQASQPFGTNGWMISFAQDLTINSTTYPFNSSLAPQALKAFAIGTQTINILQERSGWLEKTVDEIRFYSGAETETADPLIEAEEGVGEVPADHGLAKIVLKNLQYYDFGRVPTFSFVVESKVDQTLGEVYALEFAASGRDPSTYDTSALTDVVEGYSVRGQVSTRQALDPLAVVFDVTSSEINGVATYYPRRDAPIVEVGEEWLGATATGNSPIFPIETITTDTALAPGRVDVSFQDPERDLQSNDAHYATKEADTARRFDSGIVMSFAKAESLAKRLLWLLRANSAKRRFSLPQSFQDRIREGMVVRTTHVGLPLDIFVKRVDRHPTLLLECTGVDEQAHLLDQAPAESEDLSVAALTSNTNTQFRGFNSSVAFGGLFEVAPLLNEHARDVGAYIFAGRSASGEPFTGVAIYESMDDVDYKMVAEVKSPVAWGYTSNVLSTWTGACGEWDRTSTIDVVVADGEFASRDDEATLNGGGRIWVNGEVIGYATRERIDSETVRLSNLIRGLRDTANVEHAEGDLVLSLDGPGVIFHPLNAGAIGRDRFYKFVTNGQTLDSVESTSFAPLGFTARPVAPHALTATRDVSNNLSLAWIRRSRMADTGFDEPALDEPTELYEVESYADNTFASVVRTITVDEPTASYTAAQQTADGLTPGDPVYVRVRQLGAIVRQGNYAEATL